MIDISKTIIAKSDQLNSDDLIAGSKTIEITKVSLGAADQPVNLNYEGDDKKPYKPCKSMRRLMIHAWGKNGEDYVGKKMTVYNDPSVKWAGGEVGGIRISHMSHLENDKPLHVMLTKTRGSKAAYTVQPLIVKPKIALTDEAFDGFCADMSAAKTMADLSKISKSIREQNFDADGAAKLTEKYSEATKRVRALIESI
jgi:hypothetical protein